MSSGLAGNGRVLKYRWSRASTALILVFQFSFRSSLSKLMPSGLILAGQHIPSTRRHSLNEGLVDRGGGTFHRFDRFRRGQTLPAWHVVLVWATQELKDQLSLVRVAGSGEDRLPLEHLAEHASELSAWSLVGRDVPCTPQVDGWRVSTKSEKQLWRTIPSGDHQAGVVAAGFADRLASPRRLLVVLSGQSEVGNLENATVVDKQVCGWRVSLGYGRDIKPTFHVPMEDVALQG
jgi:hypothetical protein